MTECSQLKCRTPILCGACGCQCPEGRYEPQPDEISKRIAARRLADRHAWEDAMKERKAA